MHASSSPSALATAELPTPSIEDRAVGLVRLLQEHQWLAECHLTDFYVQHLWEGLPADWRIYLEQLSIPDALTAASFAGDTNSMHSYLTHAQTQIPCPESLSSFLTGLAGLPLSRVPSHDGHGCCDSEGTTLGAGLERGMTPKKLHEVDRLARIVWENLSKEAGPPPTIVDVGSGLGHLSRVLAIKYGFDVLAVEGDSCHVQSAIQVDSKTRHKPHDSAVNGAPAQERQGAKQVETAGEAGTMDKTSQKGRVRHVQFRFGGVGGGQSLVDAIRPLLADADASGPARSEGGSSAEGHARATSREFALVGLHACGDLVPQMLEAFKACDDCKAVFAVSCCYMKVTATGAKPVAKRDVTNTVSATPDPRPPNQERTDETTPRHGKSNDGEKATMYLGEGGVVVPYPMSASVSREGCPLGDPESIVGYQMREQACHALEMWTGRAKAEGERARAILGAHASAEDSLWREHAKSLTLRNHCWRAVLEQLLSEMASRSPAEWRAGARRTEQEQQEQEQEGEDEDSLRKCLRLLARGEGKGRLAGVNREKVQKHATFGSYARAVLRRASARPASGSASVELRDGPEGAVDVVGSGGCEGGTGADGAKKRSKDWVDEELARLEEEDLDHAYAPLLVKWQRPVLFYALRLALAPAIESLLLLDRLLFLRALPGVSASLLPAFHPALSPRTFLLAAQRQSSEQHPR